MIKLICFDLGGVFLKINFDWEDAVAAAGGTAGNPDPKTINHFPGLDLFQGDKISYDEYLTGLVEYLQLPGDVDPDRVHAGILKGEYPGILEFCQDAKAAGLTLACLSNTNEPHWREMHRTEIYPAFELIDLPLASHDLRMTKPSPEIFSELEKRAGVAGDEIAFFDDMEENAVSARENAGWNAFHINPDGDTAAQIRKHLSSLDVEL
jgi:FMN phosphatase YigB (HAD superfamily)